jgi:hypothetical protein
MNTQQQQQQQEGDATTSAAIDAQVAHLKQMQQALRDAEHELRVLINQSQQALKDMCAQHGHAWQTELDDDCHSCRLIDVCHRCDTWRYTR